MGRYVDENILEYGYVTPVDKLSIINDIKASKYLVYLNDDITDEPERFLEVNSEDTALLLSLNFAQETLRANGTVTLSITDLGQQESPRYRINKIEATAA